MPEQETWTIQRLMEWTRPFLERKGVEEPRLATELLLAHALSVRKIELYTRYHDTVDDESLGKFRELVRRASEHEPIAYLVGYREFFSMKFEVTPDVLIPRPETETLVQEVIHTARNRGQTPAELRILDVATGSGCIAVSLAVRLAGATVIATDISEAALAVAGRNAATHKAAVDLRAGSLYEPVAGEAGFDYICTNPPYIAESDFESLPANVRKFEPKIALTSGAEGLGVIRPLVGGAPALLKAGGMLFMEVAFDQAGKVAPLFEAAGLTDVHAVKDSLGHARVVVGRKS